MHQCISKNSLTQKSVTLQKTPLIFNLLSSKIAKIFLFELKQYFFVDTPTPLLINAANLRAQTMTLRKFKLFMLGLLNGCWA